MRTRSFMITIISCWIGFFCLQSTVKAALPEKASTQLLITDPVFQPFFEEISGSNPELEAARANWRSKLALVGPVGALPDPVLNVGLYLQEVETRVGPQQARFGISQGLPWKGKLILKGDMAAAGAEAARLSYEDLRARLFSDFRKWVFQLVYLEQAMNVTGRHVELLQDWESLMESKYTANTAKYSDWIRATVELNRMEDRLETLRAAREPVMEELNRILSRSPTSFLKITPAMRMELPETIPYSRERLNDAVSSSNPELRTLDSHVRERKIAISLSKKNFFPDFKVGVDFIQTGPALMNDIAGSGKNPVVLKFGLTLPLNRKKYRKLETAASEAFVEATRNKVNRKNAVISQLALLQFQYEDAVRKVHLYRDKLIPDIRDSLEVAVRGYESGSGSYLDIIDTERTLLALELGMEQARSEGLKALADMERITTLPLVSGGDHSLTGPVRQTLPRTGETKEN